MSKEKRKEQLGRLTETERLVLKTWCDLQKPYWIIGNEIGMAEGTVKTHMYVISSKLEIAGLKVNEKKKTLVNDFCPVINENDLEPAATESEPTTALTLTKEQEEEVDDIDWPPVPSGPDVIDPIPPDRIFPRRIISPRRLILVGAFIGAAILYFAQTTVGLLGNVETPTNLDAGPELASTVGQEGSTVIVPATPQPTQPIQTATAEVQAIVATATQTIPTATQKMVAIQPPGFVFSDDFEDGPDPLWEVQFGEPGMANGKYTVIAPFSETFPEHFALLKQNYWGNISITFELAPFGEIFVSQSANALGAVVIRFNEGEDSIGLLLHPKEKGVQFGVLSQEGQWIPHSGSLVTGKDGDFDLDRTANQFTIDAIGNTYIAYINGKKITSATIPGAEIGQFGLWFEINKQEKFVEVNEYAARFEYITIEAIP